MHQSGAGRIEYLDTKRLSLAHVSVHELGKRQGRCAQHAVRIVRITVQAIVVIYRVEIAVRARYKC